MLDAVAAVAAAIGLECCLIAVEHDANGTIADGVDGDLQAPPVGFNRDTREMLWRKQWLALPARPVVILVDQHGGGTVDHAIDKDLDEARAQHVRAIAPGHHAGFFQHGDVHEVLHVKRHPHPRCQSAAPFKLLQQFQRVEIAVHVVDRRDAMARAMGEAFLHHRQIKLPLIARRPRIGFAAGGEAKPVAVAGSRQLPHRVDRLALAQLASRQAIGRHDNLIAGAKLAALEHARHLQRLRIGPGGVMVRRIDQEGPVTDDTVEVVTGDGFVGPEDDVVGLLADDEIIARVAGDVLQRPGLHRREARDAVKLQVIEFGGSGKQMHVAFDETRNDGGTLGIDDAGLLPLLTQDLRIGPQVADAIPGNGQRFGARPGSVHGEDGGVGDDQISTHFKTPFLQASISQKTGCAAILTLPRSRQSL